MWETENAERSSNSSPVELQHTVRLGSKREDFEACGISHCAIV